MGRDHGEGAQYIIWSSALAGVGAGSIISGRSNSPTLRGASSSWSSWCCFLSSSNTVDSSQSWYFATISSRLRPVVSGTSSVHSSPQKHMMDSRPTASCMA
eukprot:EG_transcript_33311